MGLPGFGGLEKVPKSLLLKALHRGKRGAYETGLTDWQAKSRCDR